MDLKNIYNRYLYIGHRYILPIKYIYIIKMFLRFNIVIKSQEGFKFFIPSVTTMNVIFCSDVEVGECL